MSNTHVSMLAHGRLRYLWIALAVVIACIAAYAWHQPPEPANGGTWLGYVLGSIGAVLIFWLMAYGLRKRAYASTLGTVRGWLSAHVYLGTALVVVVTLHAGFQLGWNIHSLAYLLTLLVVASGVLGVVLYLRYPGQINQLRAAQTLEQMQADLVEIDRLCVRLAAKLGGEYPMVIASNRDRTMIGGSGLALLLGRDRSRVVLPLEAASGVTDQRPVPNPGQVTLLHWLGEQVAQSHDGETTRALQELMNLVGSRRALLSRLVRDAQLRAWLAAWLYLHVPASLALLAALMAHVIVVFTYW